MIIGVTGEYAAGKDCVAEILQQMSFYHVSFSDFIREGLKKQKKEITRDSLIAYGNQLREEKGASILAKLALKQVKDGENYVFTSIRNPAEVKELQKRNDFLLIYVTAPLKIRLTRLLQRSRENDPKTIKELKEKEMLENSSKSTEQQLGNVAKMAKVHLANNSSLKVLETKVERMVNDWLFKLQDSRPGWDNYFMNIAEQVKFRATCMSAKKGAIIVRDKTIISTGYNGTPKKIKHCTEGRCERCTKRHLGKVKTGVYSLPCVCCHAEENAIVQAAYNGVSTKGTVLYTTFTPCTTCAKMIINAGIKEVIAKVLYPDDVGRKLFKEAGVKLRVMG